MRPVPSFVPVLPLFLVVSLSVADGGGVGANVCPSANGLHAQKRKSSPPLASHVAVVLAQL